MNEGKKLKRTRWLKNMIYDLGKYSSSSSSSSSSRSSSSRERDRIKKEIRTL